MSIANLPYVPVVELQNIKLTNPDIQNVQLLATDVDGNIVENSMYCEVINTGLTKAFNGGADINNTSTITTDIIGRKLTMYLNIPLTTTQLNCEVFGGLVSFTTAPVFSVGQLPSMFPQPNNNLYYNLYYFKTDSSNNPIAPVNSFVGMLDYISPTQIVLASTTEITVTDDGSTWILGGTIMYPF